MASTDNVPIGSSMVDYTHSSSLPVVEARPLAGEQPAFHPNSALLIGAAIKAEKTTGTRRLLLRGPRRSGRSSLAMDMACSIADSSASRCNGTCGDVGSSCQCVAVTFLMSERVRQDALFPLQCHHVSSKSDFESRLVAIDRARNPPDWNEKSLGRIRIEHLYSLRDLMDYLLSIQSMPLHRQPWGALIVDNIEDFVRTGKSEGLSTAEIMEITQILAVLADTADTLQRTHPSISIVATMERIPSVFEPVFTIWAPAVVSILPSEEPFTDMLEDGDAVDSTFQAELSLWANGRPQPGCARFHYSIVRKSDDSVRLIWTEVLA